MPAFGPIKRNDMIRHLRQLGFEGPYGGGKHNYMVREHLKLVVPNPHHGGEISKDLLTKILRQIGIDRLEWERL